VQQREGAHPRYDSMKTLQRSEAIMYRTNSSLCAMSTVTVAMSMVMAK